MKKLILTITTLLGLTGGLSAQVAIQCQDLMVVYARDPATFKGSSILGLKADKEQFIADLKALHTLLKEKKYKEASNFFVLPDFVSEQEITERISGLIDRSEISEKGIEILSTNGTYGRLRTIFPEKADKWISEMGGVGDAMPLEKIVIDQNGNLQQVYIKKGNDTRCKKYETDDSRIDTLETKTETLDPKEAEKINGTPMTVNYRVIYPLYAMRLGAAEVGGAWNGEHFQFFRLDDVGKLK